VPLAIAGLMGAALSDAGEGLDFDLGLAGERTEEARAFAGWLGEQAWLGEGLRLARLGDGDSAHEAVAEGTVDAAVVFDTGTPRVLARAQGVFPARGAQGLVDRFLAERHASAASAPAAAVLPPRVRTRSPGGALRMIDYFAASMSVLFLNFGVLAGVRAFQEERESGVLARLAAAPVSPRALLLGKFAGLFATGGLQMIVMIAATSLLFGTRWGAPLPVAALVFATVAMAVGLTSFLMATARDGDQGSFRATIVIFVLAVVGGQFMPPQGLPDVFETLQRLTPNGQAARAFTDLAAAGPGAGLALVAEPLAYNALVGGVGIAVGVRRARRALQAALA